MDFFDRLKIRPRRSRPTFVQMVRALKSEHALCPKRPDAPSSLGYDKPTCACISLHCTCGGAWTWTLTAADLVELLRENASS